MKLKRIITVEFDRVKITTSGSPRRENLFCPVCRAESVFINETEAVRLLKIFRRQGLFINPQDLHFYQPDGARARVCLSSIIDGTNS